MASTPSDRGRISTLALRLVEGEWEASCWTEIVSPNEEGQLHHGSRGSTLPDTVAVSFEDETVALADAFAQTLENQYVWDTEYYLVLRLREVLLPDQWARLPWPQLGPGEVFLAWDKFHGHEYSRTPGSCCVMSYGGDWNDLQAVVNEAHPLPGLPLPPPSDATLLRAVRARDVEQVRRLLAAGANPDAGGFAPDEARRAVSVDRESTALWEAVAAGPPELVEALLEAGATVDSAPQGGMTPLHGAIWQRRPEVVELLLRHGADPLATFRGQTALEAARQRSPDLVELLERYLPG